MERVSDGDRNAAIKAVEAALADGRIVQADRDQRVDQLRSAQTPSELEMITHDLAHRQQTWSTYEPPPEAPRTPAPTQAGPPPSVAYGPPQTSSPEVARLFGTRRSSKAPWMLVPVLFIFLVAGSGIFGVIGAISDSDDSFEFEFDEPSITIPEFEGPEFEGPPPPPRLLTVRGFNAMLAAVRRETGSTDAFSASIYPTHASLELPAEPTGRRALTYFYNGKLDDEPRKGRSGQERFDLARIDPEVMTKLVRKARSTLVEDPNSWYVHIRRPGPPFDDDAWFIAYAVNEYGETGYLQATLDGTIVKRYVSE